MKEKLNYKKIYSSLSKEAQQELTSFVSTCERTEQELCLQRKSFNKIDNKEMPQNQVEAFISVPIIDHSADLMDPEGCITSIYNKNPVVLWGHDHNTPVGKCISLRINDDGVLGVTDFAPTEKAQEIYSLVKHGTVNSTSVGFIILNSVNFGDKSYDQVNKSYKAKFGYQEDPQRIITKWVLLEYSYVSIPDNSQALVTRKDLNEEVSEVSEASVAEPIAESKTSEVNEGVNASSDVALIEVIDQKSIDEGVANIVNNPPEEPVEIKEEKEMCSDEEDEMDSSDMDKEIKSPACRQEGETMDECTSRKIKEIIAEGTPQDQAIAIAYSICKKPCQKCLEASQVLKEKVSREIKVIREPEHVIKVLAKKELEMTRRGIIIRG